MTARDADLRALAHIWRNKGTPDAIVCAAQFEDALAHRAWTARVEAARLARDEVLKLVEAEL